MRDQVGGHLQRVAQFAVALHAFHQQVQNQQALRLSQDLEPVSQRLQVSGGMCNAFHRSDLLKVIQSTLKYIRERKMRQGQLSRWPGDSWPAKAKSRAPTAPQQNPDLSTVSLKYSKACTR
jgi:hypothetical protein